jgi:TorA maturation chaperone TorD
LTGQADERISGCEELAGLAHLRQAAYRLLSETFMPLTPRKPDELQAAARDMREPCQRAAGFTFFPALDSYVEAASSLSSGDGPRLVRERAGLFGPNTVTNPVPLHEAGFLHRTEESSGLMLASLEQHFASAGVSLVAGGAGMPDHISTELDFLSILCGREADAWEAAEFKDVRRAQDRQRRFLESHPANWLPLLCGELDRRGDDCLFHIAASAARSLVAHDVDFLEALRPHLREAPAAVPHPQTGGKQ